jgi:hypothetical protein
MADSTGDDAGTIQAVLEHLDKVRLPRMLALKQRVEQGAKLTEDDLGFLKLALEEGHQAASLVARHPEYQALASRLVSLYDEITRKALENEQRA